MRRLKPYTYLLSSVVVILARAFVAFGRSGRRGTASGGIVPSPAAVLDEVRERQNAARSMGRLKPYTLHLSSIAAVAILFVGAFVAFGHSGGPAIAEAATVKVPVTSPTPIRRTPPTTTTPPTTVAPVTAPAPTAPPTTEPPVTAPPVTAPPVTAAPVPAEPQGSAPGACGGDLPPCCVMMIESGGNPQAVNSSSGASGKWQFMDNTWQGYGGYANAADAPESVQDARAVEVWAGGAGAGRWVSC